MSNQTKDFIELFRLLSHELLSTGNIRLSIAVCSWELIYFNFMRQGPSIDLLSNA